jgi:hypothetical protein
MYPRYVIALGERRNEERGYGRWLAPSSRSSPRWRPERLAVSGVTHSSRKGVVVEPQHEGHGLVLGAQGGPAIASQCVSRGGPAIRSILPSNVTSFECWWPATGGNPGSPEELVRAHKETRTASVLRRPFVCGAGREEMPRRHPSHPLRRTATRKGSDPHLSTRVHSSGDGLRRFGYERSGREQAPAMGYGYRRGANLRRVKHWWECRPRPSCLRIATTGSTETQ